jgi:hypothetical protein
MTIDARTAAPEPSLHAATLLSRTRLAQRECAARLGISERTLRYHLTGRPMSYALRCLFEGLAWECEAAHRTAEFWRLKYGDRLADKLAQFAKGYAGGVVGSAEVNLMEGFDLPFAGSLLNQPLGRVTERTTLHGADIYRRTSDGYEWVDCEPSHPESVVFHFVRTGEKRTMRKVKRDGTA